jgi:hypothetical protein
VGWVAGAGGGDSALALALARVAATTGGCHHLFIVGAELTEVLGGVWPGLAGWCTRG